MSNEPQERNEAEDKSFADILNEFESSTRGQQKSGSGGRGKPKTKTRGRSRGKPAGAPPLQGTVVGVSGDFVLIDYGGKAEGIISRADLQDAEGNLTVERGDKLNVAITGFNAEGLAKLSRV